MDNCIMNVSSCVFKTTRIIYRNRKYFTMWFPSIHCKNTQISSVFSFRPLMIIKDEFCFFKETFTYFFPGFFYFFFLLFQFCFMLLVIVLYKFKNYLFSLFN